MATYDEKYVMEKIEKSPIWTGRALLALHDRELFDEDDKLLLNSLAKFYSKMGSLADNQMNIIRKKMVKYKTVLVKIANGEE